jgi:hypothetical protein
MGAYEQAMIRAARPQVLAAKAMAAIQNEVAKGCSPQLSREPVALEPPFRPLVSQRDLLQSIESEEETYPPAALDKNCIRRFRIWISPDQPFNWDRSERLIRQLQAVRHRVGLEITGNQSQVAMGMSCHQDDAPILRAAFRGQFDRCELSESNTNPLAVPSASEWAESRFSDVFAPAPYSHLLTQPLGLGTSPYEPLIAAMAEIVPPGLGFCRILFQPVHPDHNWHQNIETLLDLEFSMRLAAGLQFPQRYPQQSPSGELHEMTKEVSSKAHSDKPIFAAVTRVGVVGAEKDRIDAAHLSLVTFSSLFQHGGRPLQSVSDREYKNILSPGEIGIMFRDGLTYRHGCILNSSELTGLTHIPPASVFQRSLAFPETLETLPVRNSELLSGTCIGTSLYAGKLYPVCLPRRIRLRHVQLIGRQDMGKSATMENMILSDIENGDGVAVLDPHGDLTERLLCLIPEKHVARTVFLDMGDSQWVPLLNPLSKEPEEDPAEVSDDLVGALKSVVTGWGDRLESLLQFAFQSVLEMPEGSLRDVYDLLRPKNPDRDRLRKMVCEITANESLRKFWLTDFADYRKEELHPPKHKLNKLLRSRTLQRVFCQTENRISLQRIMNERKILLVNLSTIRPESRDTVGGIILSLLYQAALSRSAKPIPEREPYHIFCDEAHRFVSETLESVIAETRKYHCSLTLAHQRLAQFGSSGAEAMAGAGSSIVFNVNRVDAQHLIRDLQGKVSVTDLITLKPWEAIARIGTDIVHFKTLEPKAIPERHFRDGIIDESRRRYYRPAAEVDALIRRRDQRWNQPFTPLTEGSEEEFHYEEL